MQEALDTLDVFEMKTLGRLLKLNMTIATTKAKIINEILIYIRTNRPPLASGNSKDYMEDIVLKKYF